METVYFCLLTVVLVISVRSRIQVEAYSKEKFTFLDSKEPVESKVSEEFKRKTEKILKSDDIDKSFNNYIKALSSKLDKSKNISTKALQNSFLCFAFSKQELIEERATALYDIKILEALLEQVQFLYSKYKKGDLY